MFFKSLLLKFIASLFLGGVLLLSTTGTSSAEEGNCTKKQKELPRQEFTCSDIPRVDIRPRGTENPQIFYGCKVDRDMLNITDLIPGAAKCYTIVGNKVSIFYQSQQ
jgi:hypothetical protein